MNIAIITTWFPAGGGYVSKAYEKTLEKEHNVYIYARGGKIMKDHPDWDHPNVTWAPPFYNGIKTRHLLKWAYKKQIDILFFNEQRYWDPVLKAKKAGFCIGAYIDYYTQKTVPAFEIYDFLICNTRRHYSVFEWHKNAYYIPWGTKIIEKKNLKTINQPVNFLISAGWEGSFTGDRRGSLLAIESFRHVRGDCKLLLYSQVPFESCLPQWREIINLDKRIVFIEGTFDPFPYIKGDVFLYPSKLDGIGLTLPEALAHGIPSITTDNPPMNEFVIEGINGLLVKVASFLGREDGYYWAESHIDVEHLTILMQSMVDKGHLYLNEMKHSTLNDAKEHLDWEKNAKDLPLIFKNMFKHKTRLDQSLTQYALKLDKAMAPSYLQRSLALIKSYIVYKFKN